ncbi:MAG: ABC transporter permease [Planctomycetaceae bacterium]|nr:ABC transporter permease [Planctomycetaceae bacterium]
MNQADVASLSIWQFSIVYLLLLLVIAIMKKAKINKAKELIWATFRMTAQLVVVGLILTYVLQNPHPLFTILFLVGMTVFAIHRVISQNRHLNKRFKTIIAFSLGGSGLVIVVFFVCVVVRVSLFNPQYTIPLAGMIIANAMTGLNLGMKSFVTTMEADRVRIESLLNIGAKPSEILTPIVNNSLETALLPHMNRMLGMGIVSLPGMMTGQILSGTLPMTAILYQIAIMVAICAVVCISVFLSLYYGYRTLFNDRSQIAFPAPN